MSDQRRPWWYSGQEPEDEAGDGETGRVAEGPDAAPEPLSEDQGPGPETVDWGQLLAGAFRMVDWATSSVMAPHAEHADPAEHPQCVLCRGILLVGAQRPPAPPDTDVREEASVPSPITWIPIEDPSDGT